MDFLKLRSWVGGLTLLVVATFGSVVQAQTYTFKQIAPQQYDMQINGLTFRQLDFRKNATARFGISQRTLKRFGAGSNILLTANDDLQNNVFLSGKTLRVSLSEEFVKGSLDNPPPVPRAVFDFVQVRRDKFRLFINGHKSLWVDLKDRDSTNLFISKVSLQRFGISADDAMTILDRNFGNNQTMTADGFNISLTRDRAKGSGDTLFFFEQQSRNGFRLYLNGRKGSWVDIRDFAGDPVFQLSKTSLASRFGLTGSVDDILENFQENGIDVLDLGNGRFQFTVDRQLFLNGGTRTVEDSIFVVRRQVASVS